MTGRGLMNPLLYHSGLINNKLPIKIEYGRIPSLIVNIVIPLIVIIIVLFVLKKMYQNKLLLDSISDQSATESKIWADIDDI